uniref:Zinc finger GRF-type domain-containing protein n=1 Tax=Aegilops tauschii subsp. strangulata TaxID=200361 RepID=A0A453B6Q4_AEGTS
ANHFPFLLLFFWISTASSYLSLPDTSMVSSSSFVPAALPAAAEDIAPLPLIRCPRCNLGVIQWFISETPMNPGRHFYKCQSGVATFGNGRTSTSTTCALVGRMCFFLHLLLPFKPPP